MKKLSRSLLTLSLVFSFGSNAISQNVGLNFDGSDDVVKTNYSGIANNAPRSIEAWIKTKANCDPNNKGRQHIITDYGVSKTGGRFTFNVMYNNAIRLEVSGSGLSGQTPVNDGKWHHVAVTFNPSVKVNQVSLYVDGKLDTAGNVPTTILTANSTPFQIGERVDGINNFEGEIDEVRFFNYVRTTKEINDDMKIQYCKIPKGLVAYYQLNEGSPSSTNKGKTRATDYSGNNYHGTLSNFSLSGSTSNWVTGSGVTGGNTSSQHDVFDCYSYTSDQGNTYTSSGKYFEVIKNSFGCDSTITLNVKIGRSYNYDQYESCDSFVTPLGHVHYKSGLYRDTIFNGNAVKCDSIILMDVVVHQKIYTEEKVTECDSNEIAGKWYFSDANVELSGKARTGCDSFHTVKLKIVPSTTFDVQSTTCDAYKSSLGNTYTKTGIYKEKLSGANQYGCDSLIILDLTIHHKTIYDVPVSICDSFKSPSGVVYHKSGKYTESYSTVHGCDSIINYDLDISESRTGDQTIQECDSAMVNGKWYFESEILQFETVTVNGCDSFVTVHMTINKVDTSVVRNSNKMLTAQQPGASFQWFNCVSNAPINGATSNVFEAPYTGSFYAEITYKGCTSKSNCYDLTGLGVDLVSLSRQIQLIPNPNNGQFTISGANNLKLLNYTISDVNGRLIAADSFTHSSEHVVNQPLESGVYLLYIQTDQGSVTKRFVVK